ncbi:class I SAM-dependent methyltransferase [Schlesneria paludicola]|uniref:class I SAM-dependent methyltransferase n=1 Tax=Schlesneria paludicola TaxID=360056 RepID=UPI00029A0E90|nr:methyltransferase domain-containing protein [Schlesneria paludicola]
MRESHSDLDPSCGSATVIRSVSSRRHSVRISCVFCAVLTGLLWLLLSRGEFLSQLAAQDASTKAVPKQQKKRYVFKENHDPNGLGKFYMGREIAQVMGFPAADWLERPEREEEERLTELIRALNLQPGDVAADIGAGSGVLTLKMAEKVGETGKVFAVDIQQEMLNLLEDKIKDRKIENIELVLADETSPHLQPESLDLALMVDVYHEFAFPFETMLELSKAIKPGGRVAFVEYRREDPKVMIKLVHKMSEAQIKREISQPEFGLKWKETIKTLPKQHIVVFERPLPE